MKFATHSLALLSAALIAACGSSDDPEPVASQPSAPAAAGAPAPASGASQTIDKVAGASGFNALLAAAAKADLGPALSDANAQLTVFAPTDEAFAKLASALGFSSAAAMVDALPAAALRSILTYHVLSGSKRAAELSAAPQSTQSTLYSFEGQPSSLTVGAGPSGVTLTDGALTSAKVTATDVAASNGVVHAIDKVLIPPGVLNIVQMAQLNPELSSLVAAVVDANLQQALSGAGPFTVFAPTNAAFAQAPAGLSAAQLGTVLRYHVLGTQVLASQIPFGTAVSTLATQSIVINAGSPPTISDTTATPARIVATNVRASNGVVHVIDKVLIPAL
ncbi:fasciclin domain-containing protein [Noviherbaspirillum sp. ST9]|uniref:fasciclin domain-containing protein n=1 Tax=Noviherbaspirillum sp. ST9 TaxID=3401606 RepID=UPI003B5870E4